MLSGTVKSVHRVIEIFEFFADRQRPATLMQVARALNYPASSTSAILKSLKKLGYLDYETSTRTFVPTLRSALLGIWVNDALLGDSTILGLMCELRDKTGTNVVLGAQTGLEVQLIHVLRATVSTPPISTGCVRPLTRSAVGYALLSLKSDADVVALTRRLNSEEPDPAKRVKPQELVAELASVRSCGYAYTEGASSPSGGMIAMLLAAPDHQAPVVLGLGAPLPILRSRKQEFISELHSIVEQHRQRMEADWRAFNMPLRAS